MDKKNLIEGVALGVGVGGALGVGALGAGLVAKKYLEKRKIAKLVEAKRAAKLAEAIKAAEEIKANTAFKNTIKDAIKEAAKDGKRKYAQPKNHK